MAAIEDAVWPQPSIYPVQAADPSLRVGFSKFVFGDVIKFYYDQTNEMFGTDNAELNPTDGKDAYNVRFSFI